MANVTLFQRCILPNLKSIQTGLLAAGVNHQQYQQQREIAKHWNPKFKRLRTLKVIKIKLPNFHEKPGDVSPEQRKARFKERGIKPRRPWDEVPMYLSTTSSIFEPYVPPEGDGKMSAFTKVGAKQKVEFMNKKSRSMLAVRKIRQYEEDYDPVQFAQKAQEIYIEAHEALAAKNDERLHDLVTERAFPEMVFNTKFKTLHWQFLKSLEPPRVVQVRCTDLVTKDNLYGQVTVRFHTQQKLAVYDRFGRLMHGSEIVAKDVLEYVIFENNISNQYGQWRLHAKIIPDWAPPKQPSPMTYRVVEKEAGAEQTDPESAVESVQVGQDEGAKPPVAIA